MTSGSMKKLQWKTGSFLPQMQMITQLSIKLWETANAILKEVYSYACSRGSAIDWRKDYVKTTPKIRKKNQRPKHHCYPCVYSNKINSFVKDKQNWQTYFNYINWENREKIK